MRKRVSPGSKSDREAVVLEVGGRDLILRRRGGHAFKDAKLDALVGKRIHARGVLAGSTFIMEGWDDE